MNNLPREIVVDILRRLPITSLMQIRCVCKLWRSVARDLSFMSTYHVRASARNPCLILHCDSPIRNELYFLGTSNEACLYEDKVTRVHSKLISSIPEYSVIGSCNGILCISDSLYYNPTRLCNPFTGDYIDLPKATHYPDQKVAFGFGYIPSTAEYKLVRVVYHTSIHRDLRVIGWSEKVDVQVLTVGSDKWRSSGTVHWRIEPGPSEALVNGALHWVTRRVGYRHGPHLQIVSFNLAEEKFKEIERPVCKSLNVRNFHLVVLEGCLCAVMCCEDKKVEIWVMREYNMKESWTKDYVIGTYIPVNLKQNARPRSKVWQNWSLGRGAVQVICKLLNGNFLLEYESGAFVLYNPETEEFEDLVISGLPKWFCTFIHVESPLPVEAILNLYSNDSHS